MLEAGNSALGLCHVTQPLVPGTGLGGQRRQNAHVCAHGLEVLVLGGQVLHQCTAHGIDRRRGQLFAFQPGVQAAGGKQSAGSTFHIALKAGDLACKEHVGVFFQVQLSAEHPGRIQKGVAVHDAVPHELRMFQTRDHAEHPLLLAPLEVCLEAHDVIQGALLIFGAQLHVGPYSKSYNRTKRKKCCP